ncbi:ADP-ribosylation factor protein 3 [Malassezia sp. CBS 17886]|nr:ADP-ribosylation factor protein 3 [Malassezia sp. CBS 17886]
MYHLVAGLYAEWTQKPVYNVLFLGLKGAGKTWLLERLRHAHGGGAGPSARIASTVGQNVLDVPYRGSVVHIWDLGGSPSMRTLWDQYLRDAHAVVWVLDAPRWARDAHIAGEAQPAYRAAVGDALVRVVQDAASRAQPVIVVVAQMDAVDADAVRSLGHGDSVQAALVAHVRATVEAQWAQLQERDAVVATLSPRWDFCALSAKTGEGVDDALVRIFEGGHAHVQGARQAPGRVRGT